MFCTAYVKRVHGGCSSIYIYIYIYICMGGLGTALSLISTGDKRI